MQMQIRVAYREAGLQYLGKTRGRAVLWSGDLVVRPEVDL